MKKLCKTGLFFISLFVVAVILCGCGSTADKSAAKEEFGLYNTSDAAEAVDIAKSTDKSGQLTKNRKIIEYVDLTVETKTFDKLIDDIDTTVKKSGGYVESSEIIGNSYYGEDNRTAQLKIRIPKAKESDFSDFVSKNCNVVNRSVSTEDVTDSYIDTQSRIKALTLEKETLEKLITQSSSVQDTLTVYEKLTDVIAEIESYQSKLNQMDNLIDYITFTVNVNEVEKETKVEKQNWFVKTWNGFTDNFSDVGNGILSFLSFVIAALPYWILLGVVVVIVVLIIRRIRRKRRNKSK